MADNNVNIMNSTCSQQMELLFFDTFSHENAEELNLDLVQFPCPVIIYEIRVIPLRTQVQADLPGGVRLGATNPSTFKLELFVNNLNKPNSSTFENIGVLQYKENNIQLKPNEDVPTDGLIIKGWYNTITLAVYGILTTVQPKPERCSPPPPPPPAQPPRTKVESRPSDQPKPDHRPHPVPQQQHPLDYIQQQIKLQQIQQCFQKQHAIAHPPTALTPPVLTPPHLPVPSSQTEYRHGGSREVLHHYSSTRDKFPSSNDSRDRQEKGEREYLQFPPEPKEPFEQRDLHNNIVSRDSFDWDFRSRRNSRDSRERSLSRESSKEPRDFRENRERDVDRDLDIHGRDCDSDKDPERDRVRDREWERERDCEREQDRSRERDRDLERQREHEREIERQREREREIKRERDLDHSPGLEYEERNARPRTPPSPKKRAESPKRSQSRSPHPQLPPESILRDEDVESGELEEELYESLSDENSPETLFPPEVEVDVDMQDDERASYDDISSDDDMIATEVDELQGIELYDLADDPWNFTTASFNPLQCELVPLETFIDPSLSPYDVYNTVLSKEDKFERPEEAQVLINMIQQLKDTEHQDKWVEAMESVPSLLDKGLSFLLVTESNPDIVHKLLEWTMEGVDLDLAMKQPESVYKVRHLKMGIKLAGALSSYSPKVARMIIVEDIQHKLIDLFVSPCMSFSIKLLIVQALDSTLRYIVGFNWFLGAHSLQTSTNSKQTCYQRVLKIMLSKQLVRTTVALSCLLKKINIFEVLTTFSSAVKSVVSSLPSNGEAGKIPHKKMDLEVEQELSSDPLCSDREIENLANCLHEIHKVLVLAPDLIGQPNRSLPTNNSFDRGSGTTDPYPGLYYMFTNCGLLQAFSVLVSMPTLLLQTPIFRGIENILKQLIVTQTGLLFLISNYEITNSIIRCLLQISTADDSEETVADDSPAKQLALEVIYHLQAIIYVDQLLSFNKKDSENKVVDEPKSLVCLHALYSMTFTSVVRETGVIFNLMGRDAVVRVLEMDNNLTALLYFVEASGDRRKELKKKKSVCTGFATDLIRMLIKNSTNVQMLERFSSRLIAVSEEEINSKLTELHEWLIPCQKHACPYEGLPNLISQLKQYSEDIQKLPQSLVTVLRFLHHLAIPTETPFPYVSPVELKYKYAVIELYSADCLPVFMTILKKLIDKLLRPWQQGLPQNSEQWDVIFSILQPTIDIIKATIQYLIEARGSLFKDVTNVPILLELHTILCSAPVNNLFHSKILKVQKCVVDTLMSYTQAVLIQTDTEEALSESLWTMTIKEIFKHTAKAPYCYMGGMLLLSELLPLPLPLQSKETLTEEEVQLTINGRKLWSAHLHPLTTQFVQIISNFIVSGCQPLQNIIRRVCWQMTDLSAPSALILIKCILDQYLELNNKRTSGEEKKDNDVFKEEVVSSSLYNKILALLSWLVTQASAKSALIHILKSSNKNDEKYKEFLPSILNQLNIMSDKTVHIQIQENILNIILSLCDPEVTMITSDSPVLLLEELANCLPDKDILCQILTALLDHIEHPEHSLTSVMSCVRTLVLLTYYDYSFYHVKRCIDENPSVINKLLHRLNNCFSKDNPDCLSTLSSTIELLHVLVYIDPEEVGNRTYTLSQLEIQQILAWKTSEDHPLIELDKLLKNLDKDEVIDNLLETIGRILKFLDEPEITNIKAEKVEFLLPVGQSLSSLYNQRAVFVLSDGDEERLSPTSWLANPCNDEFDAESDVITTDVEELCKKYCGDFCLEEELHKGLDMATGEAIIVKPKRLKDIRRSQEGINIYSRGRGGARRPFVAPMRGRGIIHGMVSSGRPNDPFRSRPPNTSRPPSMHVDDFIKMEKHQGPEVSSHSTPPPPRRIEEPFRGRGRGFDRARGFNYRGRFFTPPGNYSRHDGVHPRSSIPELRGRGSKFSRPFSRGSHEFRSSMDSHGMRDRFSPRGRSPHWSVNKGNDPDQRIGNSSFRGRREPGRHVRSFTK